MDDDAAHAIVQDFLDRQGAATVAGDIEETLAWCEIPCTMESLEGRAVATTEAEMRAICATFIEALARQRLTHMMRRCLLAQARDPDTICATYETRYIREGKLLTAEPYLGFVALGRGPDRWRIREIRFAVGGESAANLALRNWEARTAVGPDRDPAG